MGADYVEAALQTRLVGWLLSSRSIETHSARRFFHMSSSVCRCISAQAIIPVGRCAQNLIRSPLLIVIVTYHVCRNDSPLADFIYPGLLLFLSRLLFPPQ